MPTKSKAAKKKTVKFYVDCWQPVEDSVLDVATFEKFLRDTIKVDNKAGNLGDKVVLSTEKTKVVVQATDGVIAKRYLKYLTKKYLKKQQLRDYLHVVATAKNTREMRYSASTPRATTARKNRYRSEVCAPQRTSAISTCGGAARIYRAASTTSRASAVGRRIDQVRRRFPIFRRIEVRHDEAGRDRRDPVRRLLRAQFPPRRLGQRPHRGLRRRVDPQIRRVRHSMS